MKRESDNIGCHVSIADGIFLAPFRAKELGASCMQIFTANQRTWNVVPLLDNAAEQFIQAVIDTDIGPVMSHDSYLINLASPDPENYKRSLLAFVEECQRCQQLAIPLLNFHPGAHMRSPFPQALQRVADAMLYALDHIGVGVTQLIIETTAGQGSSLGHRLEQLAAILHLVDARERTGICVDTAHVWAAGYDLRSEAGYRRFKYSIEQTTGLDMLKAFHVNDSKVALGSHVDRHEKIGQGTLGKPALKRLLADPEFFHIPMYLETPDGESYPQQMRLLRDYRRSSSAR